jgi:hypothetical protein
MDKPHSLPDSAHLLDDLESIRRLLGDDLRQPPLLTDTISHREHIPLLFELAEEQRPINAAPRVIDAQPSIGTPPVVTDDQHSISSPRVMAGDEHPVSSLPVLTDEQHSISSPRAMAGDEHSISASLIVDEATPAVPLNQPERNRQDTLLHLDAELRAAAQLIMQDVIADFSPHIETEIKRRLEARLERLLGN